MIQPSEMVNLIYGAVALATLLWLVRNLRVPGLPWMIAGVGFIGVAYVFTIVEGFVWHRLFDALEHSSYALSGICFCVGTFFLARAGAREKEPPA